MLDARAAYVDLNPIRAALAETLGESDFTSVQRRIQSLQDGVDADQFLAPLFIDETTDSPGPHPSLDSHRCSDKGFLPLPLADYLQLLDWTARQTAAGKLGSMPAEVPPIFERLSLDASTWCELVRNFGRLFYHVAGKPQTIDDRRSRVMERRFHLRHAARELLATA